MIGNLIPVFLSWLPEGSNLIHKQQNSLFFIPKSTSQTIIWQKILFACAFQNNWQTSIYHLPPSWIWSRPNERCWRSKKPILTVGRWGDNHFSSASNYNIWHTGKTTLTVQPCASSALSPEREHSQPPRFAILSTAWLIIKANTHVLHWMNP